MRRRRPGVRFTLARIVEQPRKGSMSMKRITGGALAALIALGACSGTPSGAQSALPAAPAGSAPSTLLGSHIKHLVVIVQENRTLDHIFKGFPGADTQTYGYWGTKKIPLREASFVIPVHPGTTNKTDMYHTWTSARTSGWNGGAMNGFGNNCFSNGCPVGTWAYAYLQRAQVKPYWDMASQYVLSDHMFPTMFGGSFTAHLDLIAGTANLAPEKSEVDWPDAQIWGCDAQAGTKSYVMTEQNPVPSLTGPFPCFTQFNTMADTLDAAKISWKYYAPAVTGTQADPGGSTWSEFDSIRKVRYGADWAKVVNPPSTVLADAKNGTLPQMTWVIPDYLDSDHSAANSDEGPSWVAAVVNAIGQGPDWNSTAIVIVWDDWGGWYDHMVPPVVDWRGLGIRVPAIIISPYAKKGYVDHTQYEFSSILKLSEQIFNLPVVGTPANGYTDTRAAAILAPFDFTQKPRAFVKISSKYPAQFFINQQPSMRAPDDD
jgi:phospholipase C